MPEGFNPRQMGKFVALAQVGLEMVAPLVLGLVADHYFNWSPWGTIVGAVAGLVFGLWHLIIILNRFDEPGANRSKDDRS
jgi:F0F1-type ATP synthase assembly protein I